MISNVNDFISLFSIILIVILIVVIFMRALIKHRISKQIHE